MTRTEKPRTWADLLGTIHPDWPDASELMKNRIRNKALAYGFEITPRGLVIEKTEPLYSGPSGARNKARDHALHLATVHGIDPFYHSPKYGQMYATHVEASSGTGLVTYRAASRF